MKTESNLEYERRVRSFRRLSSDMLRWFARDVPSMAKAAREVLTERGALFALPHEANDGQERKCKHERVRVFDTYPAAYSCFDCGEVLDPQKESK